jgi:hypothetical protein
LNEFFRRFVSCIFNKKKCQHFLVTACRKKNCQSGMRPKLSQTNLFTYLNTNFLQIVIFVGR